MTHIALVTTADARTLDDDLAPLADALRACAAEVSIVDWDDTGADWSRFDIALLRSPWDYAQRTAEFLMWAAHAHAVTRLLNPLDLVRWNIDKHYLAELAAHGVAIVPSRFLEPDDEAGAAIDAFLNEHPDAMEFVLKPAVGAGSRDAQRHARTARDAAVTHARRLLGEQRSVVLQPYLERVDEVGETALIFFDGQFSHAIRKGALLKPRSESTSALFAPEHITARTPDAGELALAQQTLAAIAAQFRGQPHEGPPLYARIDLIRDEAGAPRLLELELTEPSLFFTHAAGSAERFARALLARASTAVVTD
ncbi:MAG: hypothetical protein ABI082_04735 [Dokdonella sp.]